MVVFGIVSQVASVILNFVYILESVSRIFFKWIEEAGHHTGEVGYGLGKLSPRV